MLTRFVMLITTFGSVLAIPWLWVLDIIPLDSRRICLWVIFMIMYVLCLPLLRPPWSVTPPPYKQAEKEGEDE